MQEMTLDGIGGRYVTLRRYTDPVEHDVWEFNAAMRLPGVEAETTCRACLKTACFLRTTWLGTARLWNPSHNRPAQRTSTVSTRPPHPGARVSSTVGTGAAKSAAGHGGEPSPGRQAVRHYDCAADSVGSTT
jgi:hypothetical protein